jgi:membrane associated rhomboid family serine protease
MLKRFTPVLVLVLLCWLVSGLNLLLWDGQLNRFGIIPRQFGSLPAILWGPLLHGSVRHLAANTIPLLALGAILCARRNGEFSLVLLEGAVVTGALTWLFARPGSHIGASGLVFCFFGYLASLAYFRRTFGTLLLSLVCIVAYGGLLKGILPTSSAVSWESHAAGFLTGIVLAWSGSARSARSNIATGLK